MPARRGVISFSTLVLVVVTIGCAALVAQRLTGAASTGAALEQDAISATKVKQLDGRVVPLVPVGEPTVVMVSSRTCNWCKKALKDFGEMANGRPVPRLTLLTLEGAAEGVPMAEREALTGVRFVGPASDQARESLLIRYRGTPTFIAIDGKGRVVHTIPGYPIRPELLRLFGVMAGDTDTP
jgi:thioredoxin-related protein